MKKHILLYMCFLNCFFLAQLKAQEFDAIIEEQFFDQVENGILLSQDLVWEITSQHISKTSKINHIYFNQTLNGIQIINTESSIHLFPNNEVLTSNKNFIKDCSKRSTGSITPSLNAKNTVEIVAKQLNYKITEPLKIIKKKQGLNRSTLISNGGISKGDIPVKLKYWLNENEELILVWELQLLEPSLDHSWYVLADASTGMIKNKEDAIINCNSENNAVHKKHKELNYNANLYNIPNYKRSSRSIIENCIECYEVFPMPLESPYYGERSIVINPSNSIASPFGWHDIDGIPGSEFNTTTGNNVDVYIGNNDNNGFQPYGGTTLEFIDYEFEQDFNPNDRFQNASIKPG